MSLTFSIMKPVSRKSATTHSPQTWGYLTWGVIALGVAFVLACLPVWVAQLVTFFSALGLVNVPEDRRRATAARWREALSIHQIPVTKAATAYMDWEIRELERALAGERKLDVWRLEMLPPEVHRTYALLTLRDLDLPELAQVALRVQPALQTLRQEGA